MNNNFVDLILFFIIVFPIIGGVISKYNSKNIGEELFDIEKSLCLFIALIFSIYLISNEKFVDGLFAIIKSMINSFGKIVDTYPQATNVITFFIFIVVSYNLLKLVITLINKVTLDPLLRTVEFSLDRKKNNFLNRLMGGIFSIPKAIIYLILICVLINISINFKGINSTYKNTVNNSKIYGLVDSSILHKVSDTPLISALPRILNNSLNIKIVKQDSDQGQIAQNNTNKKVSREIVYYNGVTIEQGVKSNKEIDEYTKKIVNSRDSNREKARAIYSWIGTNIEYDDNKATAILSNNFKMDSGAIPTFRSRTGICFDYACLYVAMARASGLKVRVITGEGYNGNSWVSHAWNQVYLEDEGKWINVDSTFYKAGNYFDSKRFTKDHRGDSIAGEW